MDFVKLLQSFEDLLFELLSWVIYFPLTLWRVVSNPLGTIRYSNHEQTQSDSERYTDTISPPLFLLVCISIAHVVSLALRAPQLQSDTELGRIATASDENFIITTAFLYALLPMFAAWRYTSAKRMPLERKYLRPPFYGQCYLAGTYALLLSTATSLTQTAIPTWHLPGLAGVITATIWYLVVQTLMFRASLGWSTPRAALLAIRAYVEAMLAFLAGALVITSLPA